VAASHGSSARGARASALDGAGSGRDRTLLVSPAGRALRRAVQDPKGSGPPAGAPDASSPIGARGAGAVPGPPRSARSAAAERRAEASRSSGSAPRRGRPGLVGAAAFAPAAGGA
jgi:hypothetical protein